jgi:DNA-binding response OmpR family regulator
MQKGTCVKILLLEDDVALNRVIKKVIELDAHSTTPFFDGQEALEAIERQRYDLYILDINVPRLNGLELLELLSTKDKSAKVIIISSNTDITSIKKAYKFGCMDYLKKPFHIEELQFKIAKVTASEDIYKKMPLKKDATLTKQEKAFLQLLLEKKETIVTYEMIEDVLYTEKTMSMDSLRAMVRRLRLKLQEDIIENVQGEGYRCFKSKNQ